MYKQMQTILAHPELTSLLYESRGGKSPLHTLLVAISQLGDSAWATMNGKKGLFRQNGVAKRSDNTARAVIVCDSTLPPDHIRAGWEVLRSLEYNVMITDANIDKYSKVYKTGLDGYRPYVDAEGVKRRHGQGCKRVSVYDCATQEWLHTHLSRHKSESTRQESHEETEATATEVYLPSVLAVGMRLDVMVREGDLVVANRQPTLSKYNQLAFKLYGHDSPVIALNPVVFSVFQADCDGDEFNLCIATSVKGREDMRKMFFSNNWLNERGSANFGLLLDSVLGCVMLTAKSTRIENPDRIFSGHLGIKYDFGTSKAIFSGREILSLLVREIIRLHKTEQKQTRKFYDLVGCTRKYKGDPFRICGQLTKDDVSPGSFLFREFHGCFGGKATTTLLFTLQQAAEVYLHAVGFSISMADIYILNPEQQKEKQRRIDEAFNEFGKMLAAEATKGSGGKKWCRSTEETMLKLGSTVSDTVYRYVNEILDERDVGAPLGCNTMRCLSRHVKGSDASMKNAFSMIGQCFLLSGGRIYAQNGSPFCIYYDSLSKKGGVSLAEGGFVKNSFADGLSTHEVLSGLMRTRYENITSQVSNCFPPSV